jgi:hypothetical protein
MQLEFYWYWLGDLVVCIQNYQEQKYKNEPISKKKFRQLIKIWMQNVKYRIKILQRLDGQRLTIWNATSTWKKKKGTIL